MIHNSFIQLEKNLNDKLIEPEKGYIIFTGKAPILLSAPHSVEHLRNGEMKPAEARTASFVQYLHQKSGCFASYKTMNYNDDANYDESNYYKDALIKTIEKENIKLLFDFHIMSQDRINNIDIGTGMGKNIFNRYDMLEIILKNFEANSINQIKTDYTFKASHSGAVSSAISKKCGIPCFQFEINWRLLDYDSSDNKIVQLVDSFTKTINDLKEVLL